MRPALLAYVAHHLNGTVEQSPVIAQGGGVHARPEGAPVLSPAPSFRVVTPRLPDTVHHRIGETITTVLIRIENGKMLAEDFLRLVSLGADTALVPAGHPALGGNQEHGIVPGRPDPPPGPVACIGLHVLRFGGRHLSGALLAHLFPEHLSRGQT